MIKSRCFLRIHIEIKQDSYFFYFFSFTFIDINLRSVTVQCAFFRMLWDASRACWGCARILEQSVEAIGTEYWNRVVVPARSVRARICKPFKKPNELIPSLAKSISGPLKSLWAYSAWWGAEFKQGPCMHRFDHSCATLEPPLEWDRGGEGGSSTWGSGGGGEVGLPGERCDRR
jgi:hypothetical protein